MIVLEDNGEVPTEAWLNHKWVGLVHVPKRKLTSFSYLIISFLVPFSGPLHIEDLENILDENMVLSFNTEIEDGSIEQVKFFLHVHHCPLCPLPFLALIH